MSSALSTMAQLIPALMAGSVSGDSLMAVPARSPAVEALVTRGSVNWEFLDAGAPVADTARSRRRAKAIEYSGFYHARLTLHRWLSFAMIPLFVGSYVTGDQILKKSTDAPDWARRWHAPFATATAGVFGVNTVTGLWNLWDSRKDPAGRARRYIHSILFMVADAGFTWAGTQLANDAENSQTKRLQHRNVALASMGISVTSWSLMLFFK
jgi:hypothetical protein